MLDDSFISCFYEIMEDLFPFFLLSALVMLLW